MESSSFNSFSFKSSTMAEAAWACCSLLICRWFPTSPRTFSTSSIASSVLISVLQRSGTAPSDPTTCVFTSPRTDCTLFYAKISKQPKPSLGERIPFGTQATTFPNHSVRSPPSPQPKHTSSRQTPPSPSQLSPSTTSPFLPLP